MLDIVASTHHTLHDITEGNPNFTGIVHIQSQSGRDFFYAYPSQQDLDAGNLPFTRSKGGYAAVNFLSPGIGMIAVKSLTAEPLPVRMWSDAISNRPIGSANSAPVRAVVKSSSAGTGESKTDKNLSILLWVAVIAALVYMLSKRGKK